jgi:hypothetical protein
LLQMTGAFDRTIWDISFLLAFYLGAVRLLFDDGE